MQLELALPPSKYTKTLVYDHLRQYSDKMVALSQCLSARYL